MPPAKPTLALSTPVTASFPTDICREIPSAVSLQTPLSAISTLRSPLPSAGLPSAGLTQAFSPAGPLNARFKNGEKTPITPPLAYLDFLRSMSLNSPSGKAQLKRTSTHGSTTSSSSMASSGSSMASSGSSMASSGSSMASEEEKGCETVPSTAASDKTDCSCRCGHNRKSASVAPIDTALPSSPSTDSQHPLSAPPAGPGFATLHVLPSPAAHNRRGKADSKATPWSARSVRSPFDWDAALKARRHAEAGSGVTATKTATSSCGPRRETRTSVRHIREVVTRTITYTPRMAPAPKGKRRKVDHQTVADT